jgi:3-dehydroquinate dehydratase
VSLPEHRGTWASAVLLATVATTATTPAIVDRIKAIRAVIVIAHGSNVETARSTVGEATLAID